MQLSIDGTQGPAFHYALGQRLAPLREDGVLVGGFGNVVHNLAAMQRRPDAPAPGWATRFNDWVRERVLKAEHQKLIDYEAQGEDARLAVPTPEHYLPLLYTLGAQTPNDHAEVLTDGIDMGCVSMLSATLAAERG